VVFEMNTTLAKLILISIVGGVGVFVGLMAISVLLRLVELFCHRLFAAYFDEQFKYNNRMMGGAMNEVVTKLTASRKSN